MRKTIIKVGIFALIQFIVLEGIVQLLSSADPGVAEVVLTLFYLVLFVASILMFSGSFQNESTDMKRWLFRISAGVVLFLILYYADKDYLEYLRTEIFHFQPPNWLKPE